MKNLIVLHLESVSWQRFWALRAAFPNTRLLLSRARVFDSYFSSATSTLMVSTFVARGNDFEFDAERQFEGMQAAGNLPHLFAVLRDHGYRIGALCLNAYEGERPFELASWPEELPPVAGTSDIAALYARIEEMTAVQPFAIHLWHLLSHIEHSLALAPYAEGLTDQLARACAVVDECVGQVLGLLEHRGLLDETTIVVYGDHGDDFWTHGFKSGVLHGVEPYTAVTWSPLAILDPALEAGSTAALASTIDLRSTCLSLLGLPDPGAFAPAGIDLLAASNSVVFAQNFTASQPDSPRLGIARSFAAMDDAHALLATAQGVEFYAYRLDPGNHCNLLHFLAPVDDGLRVIDRPRSSAHFRRAYADNPRAIEHAGRSFVRLRAALAKRLAEKREFAMRRGVAAGETLGTDVLARVNVAGRDRFFGDAAPARPLFEFSARLR